MTFVILAGALTGALQGTCEAEPAESRSQISGTVVDTSGAAMSGATVQLRSTQSVLERTTHSDRNGNFAFDEIPEGEYRLVVSSPDFQARETLVVLRGSQTVEPLRIVLGLAVVSTTVDVEGRADDLIGIAESGTQGTTGAAQLEQRPLLRSGEVLETVPGVIITQHAGGGKANQYFLRGFNLDHGTDFAIFLDGMPLNLPSHAHGEGYSDMNTVIPEFVKRVNFEKGPYYGDVGNYGSAGAAHLEFVKTLPQSFFTAEGGMYGFGRIVLGNSRKLGSGTLLVGAEAYHDDGPWTHPDNYLKFNGLATYSSGGDSGGYGITARAYHGTWHSSDQIAANAVPLVGFFGTLDSTGGGHSERYSLQGDRHRQSTSSLTTILGYGFYYDLDLFSNFTYYMVDPVRGDQFEQKDRRWVAGTDARHTTFRQWLGHRIENTIGLQVRNDWIHNGLFQSRNRVRVDKVDVATGNSLPAVTQEHHFTDTQLGLFGENRVQWASRFRSVAAVRYDIEHFDVISLVTAANSGISTKAVPSPKLSLIFGPWANTEFYAQAGFSFHSNDGRGTTQHIEPISGENPYPGTPSTPIPPIIQTKGGEFGVRTAAVSHLQSTLSAWYLHSASELQQSGDTGGTTASRQPSDRYGIEWANFYTPTRNLAFDFDLANSKALFREMDPDDTAPDSAGGRLVPEAVEMVISSGVTVPNLKGWSGSMRLRYFGPRDLTSDGLYKSKRTALVNGEIGYRVSETWRITAEVLNLLNRGDHDIDYAYESRIAPASQSSFTDVFHPVEPIQLRICLRGTF